MNNNIEPKINPEDIKYLREIKNKFKKTLYLLAITILSILAYNLYNKYIFYQNEIQNTKNEISLMQNKLNNYKKILNDTKQISAKDCLNSTGCNIPLEFFSIKKINKNYKMDYDQLSIIQDLTNTTLPIRINVISFGKLSEKEINGFKIYELPITLNITTNNYYTTKDYISYLEKNIDKNNLYKIQKLKYDIVKYNQNQNVSINLKAIFYE